jgi:hypothetical protein
MSCSFAIRTICGFVRRRREIDCGVRRGSRHHCPGFFQLGSQPVQQRVDFRLLKQGIIHLQHRRPCRHQSRIVFDQQLNLFPREFNAHARELIAGNRFTTGRTAHGWLGSKLILDRRTIAPTLAGFLSHRSAPRITGQRSEAV